MHVAVLLYCCLLLAIVLFAVRTPGSTFYPHMGASSQICGPPVASQPAAICSVYCHMLLLQPLCSQMQPTSSQIHPPGVKYQPRGSPVANPPVGICTVYCNTAAYECPVQPKATQRRPNAFPRCIISAPMQPKPIPMWRQVTKLWTHAKPNDHPRTENAPTKKRNSPQMQ